MVWIHGGGFFSGSGSNTQYGPEKAMNEEIVLVTLNYRLGPLGFMCTSDGVMPGNLGLKDQLLALQWIKENVSAFGGDHDNITLFGESAGSASTHYHMLSLRSSSRGGLFHKAIMQSGTALCSWTRNIDPDAQVKEMAQRLNCGAPGKTSSAEMKRAFRQVPWEDLVRAGTKMNKMPHLATFTPVVEQNGNNKFLDQDPEEIMPKMRMIPMLIGYTANEMAPWAATLLQVKKLAPKLNEPQFISDMFRLSHYKEDEDLAAKVRNRYFGNEAIGPDTLYNLCDGLNDEMMFHPIWRTIQMFLQAKHDQLYMFKYSHEGEVGWGTTVGMGEDPKMKAAHFDEVILQFTNKVITYMLHFF